VTCTRTIEVVGDVGKRLHLARRFGRNGALASRKLYLLIGHRDSKSGGTLELVLTFTGLIQDAQSLILNLVIATYMYKHHLRHGFFLRT